jgi:hypothetical protein
MFKKNKFIISSLQCLIAFACSHKILSFYGIIGGKYVTLLFGILVFFILFLFQKSKNTLNKRGKIVAFCLSLIFSVAFVLGTIIDLTRDQYFNNFLNINNFIYVITFSILFYLVLKILIDKLEYLKINQLDNKFIRRKRNIFIIFILLFLMWLPYFISFYPALMSPDSQFQWCQAIGKCTLTNHHPVVHTLVIKFAYMLGHLFNNSNAGVAIYSLIQMLFMSFTFTYLISYFVNSKVNQLCIYATILFYGFVPIFGFYSVTMWKDVLFGAFSLLLMIQLYKIVEDTNNFIKQKSEIIKTIFFILCVGLFRSNGIFVILTIIPFIFILKNGRKQIFLTFIFAFTLMLLIKGPLYSSLNIKDGNFVENVGIPLKQMTGVVSKKIDVSVDNEKFIEKLVPLDIINEHYNPASIDPIKFNSEFNNKFLEENKLGFFKTWADIGLHHPLEYIQIYLRSTYGFWYPEAQGYIVHKWVIEPNSYNISSNANFDSLKLTSCFNIIYNMPFVKYFLSDAFYFWIIIFTVGSLIYKKKYDLLFPLIIPLSVWITTMIASPIAYQPRYTFTLFTTFPLVALIILKTYSTKIKNK